MYNGDPAEPIPHDATTGMVQQQVAHHDDAATGGDIPPPPPPAAAAAHDDAATTHQQQHPIQVPPHHDTTNMIQVAHHHHAHHHDSHHHNDATNNDEVQMQPLVVAHHVVAAATTTTMQPVVAQHQHEQHTGVNVNVGVGVGVDNSDTASEDSNTKHNASGFNPSEPRPSQRLKDAKIKMDNAYAKQEAAREVVNRITKELQAAVTYLDECSTEYQKECEAFRLIELGDPSQWNNYYKKLCDYKEKYGHCRVPYETKDDPELSALGRWVRNQRVRLTTPSRIETLNKIGFVWNLNEFKWDEKFKELKEHKEKHGTIKVERIKNESLQAWIRHQRKEYRLMLAKQNSMMTEEKHAKLKSIGFIFDPDDVVKEELLSSTPDGIAADAGSSKDGESEAVVVKVEDLPKDDDETWEKTYQELVVFAKENGHCNMYKQKEGVATRHYIRAANCRLVNFCAQQRKEYKKLEMGEKTEMTPDRKRKLDAIGFNTNYRKNNGQMKKATMPTQDELDEVWETRYQELVAYQKEHGHCNMYKRKDDNPNGHWVRAASPRLVDFCAFQRKEYKKFKNNEPSEMTPERLSKLEAIGFAFTKIGKDTRKRQREEDAALEAAKRTGVMKMEEDAAAKLQAQQQQQQQQPARNSNSYFDLDEELHAAI